MLEIHERFECGIPVIIEGETGVGKTALVEMLSILWNDALLGDQEVLVKNIYTLLVRVSEGMHVYVYKIHIACTNILYTCMYVRIMYTSVQNFNFACNM